MKKMIYAVFACFVMTFALSVNAQEEEEDFGGYEANHYICPLTDVEVIRCDWVWHDSYCDASSQELC